MGQQPNPPMLYKPWQVAIFLGISERSLERYRSLGTGPEYIRLRGHVRYAEPALLQFLRDNTIRTDQSPDPTKKPDSMAELQAILVDLRAALGVGDD